jgi:hypothetical protein
MFCSWKLCTRAAFRNAKQHDSRVSFKSAERGVQRFTKEEEKFFADVIIFRQSFLKSDY